MHNTTVNLLTALPYIGHSIYIEASSPLISLVVYISPLQAIW